MKGMAAILLTLALSLGGCAVQTQTAEPRQPAQTQPQAQAAQEAHTWDYALRTQTGEQEIKAEDGTVLVTWRFEEPVLVMQNENGETFGGHLPNHGVTEEQIAVCKAFNEAIAAEAADSLAEFDSMEADAREQLEWRQAEGIEFTPLAIDKSLSATYQKGDLLSVRIENYINVGGMRPGWGYESFNFDTREGRFFTPMSLTDDAEAMRGQIVDHIIGDIYASEWYEGYYDDFQSILRGMEDFDACFDESGMTVSFEQYTLAPGVMGVLEFTIPYAELGRYLNARGERLLDLSSEDRALSDFYEAEQIWYWFEGAAPQASEDRRTVTVNTPGGVVEYDYYRADIPGVTTMAQLRARMAARFSDELVERRFGNGELELFRDFDGVLYALPAGRGTDMYVDSVDYRAELDADGRGGRIVGTIHWRDYDEEKEEWYETGTDEAAFPFVLENGHARFTEFHTIW